MQNVSLKCVKCLNLLHRMSPFCKFKVSHKSEHKLSVAACRGPATYTLTHKRMISDSAPSYTASGRYGSFFKNWNKTLVNVTE